MSPPATNLTDLTAIIKTFDRPACLDRLLRSIRRFYPRLRIIVADDGFQPTPREDVNYLRLPPDVGVSAGRNALLDQVSTPYFLLLDDDLKFTAQTRIERLLEIARRQPRVIAGGSLMRCKRKFGLWVKRRPQQFHGTIERAGEEVTFKRGYRSQVEDYYLCDFVLNFFVARTEEIRNLGAWNPRLKTQEHEEFFLRAHQAGISAAYCPAVLVEHWNAVAPRGYSQFRNRNYLSLSMALHGIRAYHTPDGRKIDIPPLDQLSIMDNSHEQSTATHRRAA